MFHISAVPHPMGAHPNAHNALCGMQPKAYSIIVIISVVVRIDQSQSNILLTFDLIGQFLQLQPLITTFTTIVIEFNIRNYETDQSQSFHSFEEQL